MPLVIRRAENETWRECAARYGRKFGLEDEAMTAYDASHAAGSTEEDAAFDACYEWDILEFEPED